MKDNSLKSNFQHKPEWLLAYLFSQFKIFNNAFGFNNCSEHLDIDKDLHH